MRILLYLTVNAAQSEGNRKMIEEYSNKKRVLQINKENEEWSIEEDWEKLEKKLPVTTSK